MTSPPPSPIQVLKVATKQEVTTKQDDPLKTATLDDVLLSSESLVPFKRLNEKKKQDAAMLNEKNFSLLRSIKDVPPSNLIVNNLRSFCIRVLIRGINNATKAQCIQAIAEAKKDPPAPKLSV